MPRRAILVRYPDGPNGRQSDGACMYTSGAQTIAPALSSAPDCASADCMGRTSANSRSRPVSFFMGSLFWQKYLLNYTWVCRRIFILKMQTLCKSHAIIKKLFQLDMRSP